MARGFPVADTETTPDRVDACHGFEVLSLIWAGRLKGLWLGTDTSCVITLVVVLALAVVLTFIFACRFAQLLAFWSVLWAVVLGFWLLAPPLFQIHHLAPHRTDHWLVAIGFLTANFAMVGLVLGAGLYLPVAGIWQVRRFRLKSLDLAAALWSFLALPPMYVAAAALLERLNLAKPPLYAFPGSPAICMLSYAVVAAIGIYAYRAESQRPRVRLAAVLSVVVLAGLAGAIAVPFRLRSDLPVTAATFPTPEERTNGRVSPLLVVGIDGGSWRVLEPVIKRGHAPTFRRMMETGLAGTVDAKWFPYWSTPAWGAILTGYSQDDLGVHEDLEATAPGLPRFELPLAFSPILNPVLVLEFLLLNRGIVRPEPPSRLSIPVPPVWERLTRAGRKTAVVRFHFSYPATNQSDYVVSDRVLTDLWDDLGVKPGDSDKLVTPAERSQRVLRWFSESSSTRSVIDRLLAGTDGSRPEDSLIDPRVIIKQAVESTEPFFNVAQQLLKDDPDIDVLMMHVAGLDQLCHALWKYRFPDEFPVGSTTSEEQQRFGIVMDRFVEYLDQRLGELVGSFPEPPNTLVLSDHGSRAIRDYPLWSGWHSDTGIFIAAGPDIPARPGRIEVSYSDVAPTIFGLQGLTSPPDLRGHSLLPDTASLSRLPR